MEADLHEVPLTALTYEARNILSCLLNTSKILLSDGPDRLLRDWRGLATLVNISAEITSSYESKDKIAKVLEYWIQKRDGTATVGKLLEYVQRIDRYDIFDDFMALCAGGKLILTQPTPPTQNQVARVDHGGQLMLYRQTEVDEDIITFDDKIHGFPQFYHGYILYAQQDREFVIEMILRMREKGYKLCTEEDLLPDHTTTYAPVSRLISSDRCHRIVLVYSPDFIESPANNFYMDYAQAVGIEMKRPKIIPCMYRDCILPAQVTFYHKLYYRPTGARNIYDFWDRLGLSLDTNYQPPRLNGSSAMWSSLNITELRSSQAISNGRLLALMSSPRFNAITNAIEHLRNTETEESGQSSLSAGSNSTSSQSAGSQSPGSRSPDSHNPGIRTLPELFRNNDKKRRSRLRRMIRPLKFWKKMEGTKVV